MQTLNARGIRADRPSPFCLRCDTGVRASPAFESFLAMTSACLPHESRSASSSLGSAIDLI